MAATNPLEDDDAAIIAQFWTEDARRPRHAVRRTALFCEPIERLIIDRHAEVVCTAPSRLQEKGLHNHIWDDAAAAAAASPRLLL